MCETVTAMEVRNRLGDLLSRAFYTGEQFIIERRGKPMAVIMGMDEYRRYLELKNGEATAALDHSPPTGNTKDIAVGEALAIIQKALQEVTATP